MGVENSMISQCRARSALQPRQSQQPQTRSSAEHSGALEEVTPDQGGEISILVQINKKLWEMTESSRITEESPSFEPFCGGFPYDGEPCLVAGVSGYESAEAFMVDL